MCILKGLHIEKIQAVLKEAFSVIYMYYVIHVSYLNFQNRPLQGLEIIQKLRDSFTHAFPTVLGVSYIVAISNKYYLYE